MALAFLVVAQASFAQDIERGRLLYETHCLSCHAERLHEREKSKVSSLADLRRQVERWSTQTARAFTQSEREDLVSYLDAVHYHLERGAQATRAAPAQ